MRKLVQILAIGTAIGAFAFSPVPDHGIVSASVDAAPALAFLTGTVKDEGGQPLAGAVIALLEVAFNGKEIKSVFTDVDGKFSAAVRPGPYRLRAAAEGFKPVLTKVVLDRSAKLNYDIALKRDDTLVDKRGDRDDYRWIGRSVPRHVLHLDEIDTTPQNSFIEDRAIDFRPTVHGMVQLLAVNSLAGAVGREPDFYGTNFAISGSLSGNFEMAVIGQRGAGALAPQRVEAIATMRPWSSHQFTASVGYGQMAIRKPINLETDGPIEDQPGASVATPLAANGPVNLPANGLSRNRNNPTTLDQVSLSAVGQWQVFQPLLVIYGFDYARFVGSTARNRESILPRLAFQFSPTSRLHLKAALTPGAAQSRIAPEGFEGEDIQASFDLQASEVGYGSDPVLDRSRRMEFGIERILGDGSASIEAAAFYDIVAGHSIGVLALPLEATSEAQAAFQQMANQVQSMNGAARGIRVMFAKRLGDEVTASFGYSFGSGSRFNSVPLSDLTPSHLLQPGFFQVATAKLDLDFSRRTGTRISTVVRLSPQAVVFAIDPFAGQVSVYDPNINIYVTQELPNLGLPFRWQALVDIRNLLNQSTGVEDGAVQLVSSRSYRTVRGGVAFRW
jgi:hypothetical protein